jgi:hypothetical protein
MSCSLCLSDRESVISARQGGHLLIEVRASHQSSAKSFLFFPAMQNVDGGPKLHLMRRSDMSAIGLKRKSHGRRECAVFPLLTFHITDRIAS